MCFAYSRRMKAKPSDAEKYNMNENKYSFEILAKIHNVFDFLHYIALMANRAHFNRMNKVMNSCLVCAAHV